MGDKLLTVSPRHTDYLVGGLHRGNPLTGEDWEEEIQIQNEDLPNKHRIFRHIYFAWAPKVLGMDSSPSTALGVGVGVGVVRAKAYIASTEDVTAYEAVVSRRSL
jgi:hypothetical protein